MIRHITEDLEISSDEFDETDEEQIKWPSSSLKKATLCLQNVFYKIICLSLFKQDINGGMTYFENYLFVDTKGRFLCLSQQEVST